MVIARLYLIAKKGGQVNRLRRIIFREGFGLATVTLGPLLRQKSFRSVPGGFELPVRHCTEYSDVWK